MRLTMITMKLHINTATTSVVYPRAFRLKGAYQAGATLIEILVSVLILSFGLLGMAALQTRALQGNQSSVQRSQAIMLNQYMMDAMRVDRENAKGSAYNINYTCGPDGISGTDTLAKNNMRAWLDNIEKGLGVSADTTSCGSINCDASYVCTVRIKWDDSKAGGLAAQVVELRSTI
jgi:type IV pilus assembly protein PilV